MLPDHPDSSCPPACLMPHCGRLARRKRLLHRRVRPLAHRRVAWLEVTHAEYRARCGCCKYFRTWPLEVRPKADYDAAVQGAGRGRHNRFCPGRSWSAWTRRAETPSRERPPPTSADPREC